MPELNELEDAALVEWIGLEAFLEGLEVLVMAGESTRVSASEHYNAATAEAIEQVRAALRGRGLLSLPWRCTTIGGGHYLAFLRDMGGIVRDMSTDLDELRRGTRERIGMVFDQATSSSRN